MKINVKKLGGGSYCAFLDTVSNSPISVTTWDQECPDGYFAFAGNFDAIRDAIPGYELNILERPVPNLPNSKRVRATTEDLKGLDTPPSTPPPPGQPNGTLVVAVQELEAKALKEIEMFLVKLEVAEGKKAKALREEYFFVRKLIFKLFPQLAEKISALEMEYGSED